MWKSSLARGWRRRADAGVAVAQHLGRNAIVARFPAGSGWSVQALLDQRASLDTSALVRGKVVIGIRTLSGKTVAARRDLLRVRRWALDLQLLCRWHSYTEARCHRLRCWLRPEQVIALLGGTLFVGCDGRCVTATLS